MSGRGRILGPKNISTFSGFWSLTENQQDVGVGNWAFSPVVATGGTESTVTIAGLTYKLHVFTGTGTFSVTSNTQNRTVDYLVQAGGGGGQRYSGGGGAGGQIQSGEVQAPVFLPTARNYTLTIGAGGNVGNGSNTSIQDVVTVTGGGCSVTNANSNNGGSGGGRQYNYAIGTGIAGPPRQGYDGGFGGGGSGAAGTLSTNNGGNGRVTTIRGSTEYFGGGGVSSGLGTGVSGTSGGLGGGGNYNTAGAANTGGGGGSSINDPPYSNPGGSGIIIIRYRIN
jgi:hypothetical protein